MSGSRLTTRFRDCSRVQAIAILCFTLLLILACVWAGGSNHAVTQAVAAKPSASDSAVMIAIARRVHDGQHYYIAAADELRSHGYGIRSVFNWRQPLFAWLLGILPSLLWGRVLLAALGVIALLLSLRWMLRQTSPGLSLFNLWLLSGAVFSCFAAWGIGSIETWASVLILLSVLAYAESIWWAGLITALLAMFFRELTAPYAIICIALACRERRWREIVGWVAGLMLYGCYFYYHLTQVHAQMRPNDHGYGEGWIQFGGLRFILDTVSQNGLLIALPLWVSGVYLPLALLGLIGIRGDFGVRIASTVVAYLLLFSIVGKSFNDYWGYLTAPLLSFGLPWLLPVAVDLWNSSRQSPKEPRTK